MCGEGERGVGSSSGAGGRSAGGGEGLGEGREHPGVWGRRRGGGEGFFSAAVREALAVGSKQVGVCRDADLSRLLVELRAGAQECGEARIPGRDSSWADLRLAAASRTDVV